MNNLYHLIKLDSIDSTHTYAKKILDNNVIINRDPNKVFAIIANEQTNGFGRYGRSWISEKGNLYSSIIVPTVLCATLLDNLGQISLTVTCAVRETILKFVDASLWLRLHWPNDIYYKNNKLSGILIELYLGYLIISIGVNIENAPKNINCGGRMTTDIKSIIFDTGGIYSSRISAINMLDLIIDELFVWLEKLKKHGFTYIKDYWLLNINQINCNISVKTAKSKTEGIFVDIDDVGRLVLIDKYSEKKFISSGDVFINHKS